MYLMEKGFILIIISLKFVARSPIMKYVSKPWSKATMTYFTDLWMCHSDKQLGKGDQYENASKKILFHFTMMEIIQDI